MLRGGLDFSKAHLRGADLSVTLADGNGDCDDQSILLASLARAPLDDVLADARGDMAWSADGQYLFYLDKHPETLLAYRVMRHKLGTDPAEDVLVYEEQDYRFYTGLGRSRSGDYIVLQHMETDTSEVQLLAANDPLGEFKPFLPRETGHEYDIDHANGRFFIRTNWEAENFRVMTAELDPETQDFLLDGLEGKPRRERAELITWLIDRGFTVERIGHRESSAMPYAPPW